MRFESAGTELYNSFCCCCCCCVDTKPPGVDSLPPYSSDLGLLTTEMLSYLESDFTKA